MLFYFFFFQAEDGIRDESVTGVQTCALPISESSSILQWAENASRSIERSARIGVSAAAITPLTANHRGSGLRPRHAGSLQESLRGFSHGQPVAHGVLGHDPR